MRSASASSSPPIFPSSERPDTPAAGTAERPAEAANTSAREDARSPSAGEITVSAPFLRALVGLSAPSLLGRREPTRLSHQPQPLKGRLHFEELTVSLKRY